MRKRNPTLRHRKLLALLCVALSEELLFSLTRGKAVSTPIRLAPKAERAQPAVSPTAQPKPAPPVSSNQALSISAVLAIPAQSGGSYNITQSVITSGGGTSTNNNTSLSGSTGQSMAANSSGGIYALSGGFWVRRTSLTPQRNTTLLAVASWRRPANLVQPISLPDLARRMTTPVALMPSSAPLPDSTM